MTLKLIFWAATLVDGTIAVIIFVSALSSRMPNIPVWYRIGLLITALGFTVQGFLNLPYLLFNVMLMAQELPFWILKDVGVGVIAIYYFCHTMCKDEKPKKRSVVKKTTSTRTPRKTTPAK